VQPVTIKLKIFRIGSAAEPYDKKSISHFVGIYKHTRGISGYKRHKKHKSCLNFTIIFFCTVALTLQRFNNIIVIEYFSEK